MRAYSPVTAVVVDCQRPGKPLHAESLGFSDTVWESVQLCWSESISTRPTAAQLFDDLFAAARTWAAPSVYPIEVKADNTIESSSLSIMSLMNLIHEA